MINRFSLITAIQGFCCVLAFSTCAYSQNAKVSGRINVSRLIDTTVTAGRMDNAVNSIYIEEGPMLTKDGERLYFSRHGDPKNKGGANDQDIWYSDFDDATQSWGEAINVGAPLNNKGPNFICGVGWKGDTVLLGNVYAKNGKMRGGLSVSIRSGDVWSFPAPAFINNDYNHDNRVAYDLSHDRAALVIAQKKDDSRGGLDLYVAFRDSKNGNPYMGTESINLGDVINSTGDETSPFLSYDGETLFFSSNGHKGYGKEDIFMSERLDETWTKWSKPQNLGPGINTPFDDSYFGYTPSSRHAYYSRGISHTNSDIYEIELTHLFRDPDALFHNLETDSTEIVIGQTHTIKNVFDNDGKVINKEAMAEIQAIFNYLERFKTMTVLISAHSNKHDTRHDSFTLSNERTAMIKDYLVKNGIEKSRLTTQGFGHDILVNTIDPSIKKDIASSVEFKFVNYGR